MTNWAVADKLFKKFEEQKIFEEINKLKCKYFGHKWDNYDQRLPGLYCKRCHKILMI